MLAADRPVRTSARLRRLRLGSSTYGHVSGVPLSYLALPPGLDSLLARLTQPARVADLPNMTPADTAFLGGLLRMGILVDAAEPDPVHDFRGRPELTAGLYLYPTNSCNLRCIYCYATSGPGAGPRLSSEHALMAVDDFFATLAPEVRMVSLRFHGGGEPTTNFAVMTQSWDRFRQHAAQRGLQARVSTITNGTFGASVLRVLREPEWAMTVSYDGPRQATQRPTAADTDSRDRVVANLRRLRAAGKFVTTRATLTRDGLPHMRALVDDAAEVGIHAVQVEPASIVGRGANLADGPPDPLEFAEAYLDAFGYGLELGVEFTTAAWSSTRVGDGRFCGAISGSRALTPDGFVSACTEACDGNTPDDPFIVGRLDPVGRRLEIWPVREATLQRRTGYNLPTCQSCYMVDTCAGGCASRAQAQTGSAMVRDDVNCVISRLINPRMIADLADGRLLPDLGWQPISAHLDASESSFGGGSVVAMVPAFARALWNRDPERRPFIAVPPGTPRFFHLPIGAARATASPPSRA
ncbi:MAG: uncharacterized protein QG597_3739 [Actinomycetota bacterium]|nr:uncharacterized protein [Actinomycetota bacterium]